jgi:hypothetical protein
MKFSSKELDARIELLHKLPKELPQFRLDVMALLDTFAEAITPIENKYTPFTPVQTARDEGFKYAIDTIHANTKELLGD